MYRYNEGYADLLDAASTRLVNLQIVEAKQGNLLHIRNINILTWTDKDSEVKVHTTHHL